jgi:hypothetical protein
VSSQNYLEISWNERFKTIIDGISQRCQSIAPRIISGSIILILIFMGNPEQAVVPFLVL